MPRMSMRTDEDRTGNGPEALRPACVVSAIPSPRSVGAWSESWSALVPLRRLEVPLPEVPGLRGAGARLSGTPLPGALVPRAVSFADMPDVMCCLLMASLAALMSIMGHGRHVQTGVPMTHLNPEKPRFYLNDVIWARIWLAIRT